MSSRMSQNSGDDKEARREAQLQKYKAVYDKEEKKKELKAKIEELNSE